MDTSIRDNLEFRRLDLYITQESGELDQPYLGINR